MYLKKQMYVSSLFCYVADTMIDKIFTLHGVKNYFFLYFSEYSQQQQMFQIKAVALIRSVFYIHNEPFLRKSTLYLSFM
jgi:hypothetical protein